MSKKGDEKKEVITFDEIITNINKSYGKGSFAKASEIRSASSIPRLPLDILDLDLKMGGGLPLGRCTMFKGMEGSGKTSLAMIAVAKAQRTCRHCQCRAIEVMDKHGEIKLKWDHEPDCNWGEYGKESPAMRTVWIDAEGSFFNQWAMKLGVDVENLYMSVPESSEQAIDIMETLIRNGVVDLIVLDSIAALSPLEEINKSAEEGVTGTHAKLMNAAIRRWTMAMTSISKKTDKVKPTIILINQIRMKIGVMFGSPETLPGGKMQLFFASTTIRITAQQPTMGTGKQSHRTLLWNMRFKVETNKTGPPKMSGDYPLAVMSTTTQRQGQIVDFKRVLSLAKEYGIVYQEKKMWVYKAGIQGIDPKKHVVSLRVQDDLVDEWQADLELFQFVKSATLEAGLKEMC